jgi:bifunctional non-homologous end joining protein LigD
MKPERIVEGVRLSNPDKVLYPEQGITKGQLADYYVAVAGRILPHLAFRPVTMVRCPMGQETKCFYQRHAGSGVPEQLHEVTIPGFDEPYLYISDVAGPRRHGSDGGSGNASLGGQGRRSGPGRPDRLRPRPAEGLGFEAVIEAAREVRDRFEGARPRQLRQDDGRQGAARRGARRGDGAVEGSQELRKGRLGRDGGDAPDKYLTKISKADASGRIFIDYLRNDPTSTPSPLTRPARARARRWRCRSGGIR